MSLTQEATRRVPHIKTAAGVKHQVIYGKKESKYLGHRGLSSHACKEVACTFYGQGCWIPLLGKNANPKCKINIMGLVGEESVS